jgi:hypothetical protein
MTVRRGCGAPSAPTRASVPVLLSAVRFHTEQRRKNVRVTRYGFSDQEASQAHVEEEAPQVASQDTRAA